METKQTNDYSLFKRSKSNRRVDMGHVKRLMDAMNKYDLSSSFPIITNEAMEIMDGQHRFEARKDLGLPVFYKIDPKYNDEAQRLINSNQKTWSSIDFIRHFASLGNANYSSFIAVCSQHQIPYMKGINILVENGGKQSDAIKNGLFKFGPDAIKVFKQRVEWLRLFSNYSFYMDKPFITAFNAICTHPNFDIKRMEHVIKFHPYRVKKQGLKKEYISETV